MKSKFTSIIMILIIITIVGACGLLGIIIIQETTGIQILNALKITENDDKTVIEDFEPEPVYREPVEKKIEKPKIRTKENSLVIEKPEEPVIDYDNIIVNKHFYNQLEEPSQKIYKAFEQNKENMKTGTYRIHFGDTFSNILAKEDGQDELGDYYQAAMEAYAYDNPDVFYINVNKMFLNIETTTKGTSKTYNVYIDCGDNANYLSDEFPSKGDIDTALNEIEEIRKQIISQKTADTYSNIKLAHDYLTETIDYDAESTSNNIYNIYGALVDKRCVCEGYAKAFKYLLDGLGIESVMVIGSASNSEGATENHAWNYVKIEEIWYAVDVTWDDPIVIGGGYLSKESRYRYFLKGKQTINENHLPSGKFTENGKNFEYPKLSEKDY